MRILHAVDGLVIDFMVRVCDQSPFQRPLGGWWVGDGDGMRI